MKFLELKVPPPIVAIIFACLMYLSKIAVQFLSFSILPTQLISIVLFLLGSIIALSGVIHFKKAKTTVNPLAPESTSSIVTTGIYSYSRNPMYLGFLLMLFAWGIYLSNILSCVVAFGFVLYINRFQILPEERVLLELFGDLFKDYKNNVRRWI